MLVTLAAALALFAPTAAQASRPPIVVVVLDELPTTSLLGKGRRIDATRYPNFAALAGDSTWFRNATTVADSTFSAVPSILDGRLHRWKVGQRLRPPSRSMFSLFAGRGYRVRANSEGGACPVRWCGPRRPTRYYLVRQRPARLGGFIRSIGPTGRPTLWFKHTLLPHVPWIYLPSGRQYSRGVLSPIGGLNSERGVHSRWLVRLAYQRHLLQVGALDRWLGTLLQRLRTTGLYDRALLVVTADHGISFRLGERDRRTLTRANVAGVAPVPLFIKRPGQRRGRVSRAHARVVDVLPTIASLTRTRMRWRTDGRPAFSRAVRRRRTVRMTGRSPASPVVKLSTRDFGRRWSRVIRYQHSVFGFGDRGPGLYGIGPHASLAGRTLTDSGGRLWIGRSPVDPPGRLRATVYKAAELKGVVPGSFFVPSLVTGRIQGGRSRGPRDVAVAVNGRIAATGRSFRIRGRRREEFAVLVPETALQAGANRVEVLSVARRRGRLHFRLIARI